MQVGSPAFVFSDEGDMILFKSLVLQLRSSDFFYNICFIQFCIHTIINTTKQEKNMKSVFLEEISNINSVVTKNTTVGLLAAKVGVCLGFVFFWGGGGSVCKESNIKSKNN